jgi:orotidine-5'-phosphate decarboxylase
VLEAVGPVAAAVKFQSACFERYLSEGWALMHELMRLAHGMGLVVILDAKRSDIGISSEHYAAATIGCAYVDAVTVSAYMGDDSLVPFVGAARDAGKGLFVLVRTSNPGSAGVQELTLKTGGTVADEVAQLVARLGDGEGLIGECGYSAVGAVVGATQQAALARLRTCMPRQVLLLPGYGAQGAAVEDVRPAFAAGRGGLVTASRSILYPQSPARGGDDWTHAVATAAAHVHGQLKPLMAGRSRGGV